MSQPTTPRNSPTPGLAAVRPDRVPERLVPTRRVDFGFGEVDLPRHFMNGDLIQSHMVVVLSCLFPDGEDFFVRSVRNYRDRITDPVLRKQVAGFIGQEAVHGREHRAFNEALRELGYPTRFNEARVRIMLRVLSRVAPKSYQLALTAALEHYTATLAELLLTTDLLDADTDVEEIRQLFVWHAVEESEHKAVAFDVFMQVCGSERIRVNVMRLATVGFVMAILVGMTVSLATDRSAWNPVRLWRSLRRFRHHPMLSTGVWRRIRQYNEPGFHPDDIDTEELLEEWREKLFAPDGLMADKVKGVSAA